MNGCFYQNGGTGIYAQLYTGSYTCTGATSTVLGASTTNLRFGGQDIPTTTAALVTYGVFGFTPVQILKQSSLYGDESFDFYIGAVQLSVATVV